MTATQIERDHQDQDGDDAAAESSNRLGRALDVAGIVAGVVLGVILFDIVSGGKLTRWARARRGPGKPSGPCEGCGQDDSEATDG
jgi:hypothetical protein